LVQILLAVAFVSGHFGFLELVQHDAAEVEPASLLKSFVDPLIILAILFRLVGSLVTTPTYDVYRRAFVADYPAKIWCWGISWNYELAIAFLRMRVS
jgi:hypothetical protein